MVRIAKVLSFFRTDRGGVKLSEVKLDPDGGSNITADHFSSPGDDSFPLSTDFAVTVNVQGGEAAIAYADSINEKESTEGDVRKIGRDPSTGFSVNQVWLKSDGSVVISNNLGAIELKADGSVDINGATITVLGDVITKLGRSLDLHVHPITGGSSAPGPTGSAV